MVIQRLVSRMSMDYGLGYLWIRVRVTWTRVRVIHGLGLRLFLD